MDTFKVTDLEQLAELQQAPEPFAPGDPLFWNHPHISSQMLATHLDPDTDAASRRPGTIDRSVAWLVEALALEAGDTVLDLGCGPGLYASHLARQGLRVTGVDYSRRSIDYARQYARQNSLDITYRYQDYLTLDDERAYDAALLIFGDYCVLPPEDRSRLLQKIRRALRAGGRLAFDVSTRAHRARHGLGRGWYVAQGGFWRPGLHLVLEQGFDYPEQSIYLDQYVIIDADGTLTVYRNWFQDYTPQAITRELEVGGFAVLGIWGDLTGTPYTEGSEWIGVVADPQRLNLGKED